MLFAVFIPTTVRMVAVPKLEYWITKQVVAVRVAEEQSWSQDTTYACVLACVWWFVSSASGYGWRDVRGSISDTRLARFKFGCDLKHCTPPSHINKGSNHDENSVIQVPSHNIGLECLEICWE